MASAEHLERIRSQGYTVMERLLDDAALARLRDELSPWLQGRLFGRNDFEGTRTERVYALLAKAPSVSVLIEHPDVLALVDALLPPNYLLSAALAINLHPGETAQDFHIDDAAGGRDHPMFTRPRDMLGVSTIWAIDDFTADNGATEVVPGSHRWGPERRPTDAEAVPVLMPAGSVLVFAGNLIHRGGANRSGRCRLAITPQYCMPWLRQIEHMVLAVPPEIAARYSSRVQELLGYNIIDPGFMGYVDGRHPKHLIDPHYQGRKHHGMRPGA
ncbi:MAG: phytanoyl-CoA dioxygenase family protein [Pseudomonadales bacterium]